MDETQHPLPAAPVPWDRPPDPLPDSGAPALPVRLDVGAVLGRTLDVYGSDWSFYLVLALPAAVVAGVVSLVALEIGQVGAVVLSVVSILPAVFAGIAATFAVDDSLTGRQASLGSAVNRAGGRLVPVLGAYLLFALVLFGVIVVLSAGIGIAQTGGSGLALVLLATGAVLITILGIRWSLIGPAATLEPIGSLAALRRSRLASRGNTWRLFGLLVVIGLLAMPGTIGAALLDGFATARPIAAMAVFLATLVTTPLAGLSAAIAYGDLTGRGYWSRETVQPGRGRALALTILLGLGAVLFVLGVSQLGQGIGQVLANRGAVVAGTSQNLLDPCWPEGLRTTFSATDEIWIGAVFSRHVDAGETVQVEFRRDDEILASDSLVAEGLGMDCYYEQEPIVSGLPGSYRLTVRHSDDVVADGGFVIAE